MYFIDALAATLFIVASKINIALLDHLPLGIYMASIQVSYPHQRTMAEARAAVQLFSAKLEKKLGVKSSWQGDALMLERQGVKGSLVLKEGLVEVELTLGMMLMPMKGQIETEVNKQLERCLG